MQNDNLSREYYLAGMKSLIFEIESNVLIAKDTFRMTLLSADFKGMKSGQFVDVAIEGRYLRRPISVCDSEAGKLALVYKTVGEGTLQMSKMTKGMSLDILIDLGHGFTPTACKDAALLLGGGVGVAPLYQLTKELKSLGKKVTVVLGFNTASEVALKADFEALGADVYVATMDGSEGTKGFVTDVVREYNPVYDYYYTCGPKPMEKAVYANIPGDGEISLEERMGCGTGICYGCTCQTTLGPKRICKDGPVFKKEEISW